LFFLQPPLPLNLQYGYFLEIHILPIKGKVANKSKNEKGLEAQGNFFSRFAKGQLD